MNEKKKHKIMLGIEVVLLCMIVAILGTNAASSNPPSNGVSYGKNNQTTVEGALNDLYTKANYGNATASQILKGKTALVGGKQVIGTYEAPTLASQTKDATAAAGDILSGKTAYVNGSKITGSMVNKGAVSETVAPGGTYTIPAGYHNGSGKATCSTCESSGYSHAIRVVEDITDISGSNVLKDGTFTRFCSDNQECNISFKVRLSEKLPSYSMPYFCSVSLIPGYLGESSNGDPMIINGSFRFGKGYSQNSATAQYWYTHYLSTSSSYQEYLQTNMGYAGFELNSSRTSWGGSSNNAVQSRCSFNTYGDLVVDLTISDNALAVDKNKFVVQGVITY